MVGERAANPAEVDGDAELGLERGHHRGVKSTGVDAGKVPQIGRDIYGHPMKGHPPAAGDADRGELSTATPDPRLALFAARLEPESPAGGDDAALEGAEIRVEVALAVFEGEDGVGDDLSRPVIGGIAAALGLNDGDVARRENVGPRIATAAEGDDVGVLDED